MLEIKDYDVMGFRMAINGIRNALSSWDKSDSHECGLECSITDVNIEEYKCNMLCGGYALRGYTQIGPADMKLAKSLIRAGSSDRKFLRMIHVQADVLAPLYWWKEADQYKVGTTTNSCSTMHTLHKEELTLENFSYEHLSKRSLEVLKNLIDEINRNRSIYVKGFKGIPGDNAHDVEPHDKAYWWQIIQLLPSSFEQLRTWDLDYETLLNIYFQRRNHKLDEWHTFCDWIKNLPYMSEFIGVLDKKEEKYND